MGNTRNIHPKTILTHNGSKDATILALTNFYDYHFDNGTGKATFKLIGMESPGMTFDGDGNPVALPPSAVEYLVDEMLIPANIIQQWGADDTIIWDYVAQTLNLTFNG